MAPSQEAEKDWGALGDRQRTLERFNRARIEREPIRGDTDDPQRQYQVRAELERALGPLDRVRVATGRAECHSRQGMSKRRERINVDGLPRQDLCLVITMPLGEEAA